MTIFRRLLLLSSALAMLGIGVVANAFEGSHRVMDWAQLLDLSSQQQADIKGIEASFLQHFQQLRDDAIPRWGQGFDEQRWLEQRARERELEAGIRQQLRQVLNESQRLKADTIVQRFHTKAAAGMLERITQKLDLTADQRHRLKKAQASIAADFHWPIDHRQMELTRIGVEKLLSEYLTPEQLEVAQQRRQNNNKRWPKPEDFRDDRERRDNRPRPPFDAPPRPDDLPFMHE
jgi:hypothetical protein